MLTALSLSKGRRVAHPYAVCLHLISDPHFAIRNRSPYSHRSALITQQAVARVYLSAAAVAIPFNRKSQIQNRKWSLEGLP
jgi:hypothetical protein